jgi:hypothetical protein
LRRRESRIRQRTGLCAKDCKISRWIPSNDDRGNAATVHKGNPGILCALDHVLVGQHIPVRSYDHAGASTTPSASRLACTADIDTDHRRSDVLDRAYYCSRVSVQRVVL